MIREQKTVAIEQFYSRAWEMYDNCIGEEYKASLAPILATELLIDGILAGNNARSLDPAIPAFVAHCAAWGEQFGSSFDLIHDDSQSIFAEQGTLELLMSKDEPYKEIGYDRRKLVLPLRANGITFCDSKIDRRLQVADLFASSVAYWANGLVGGQSGEEFWDEIDSLQIRRLIIGTLWPTPKVTPEELDTDPGGGINLVDYMADFLLRTKT